MDKDKYINEDDSGDDEALLAATQSQMKGRGNSPLPYAAYGFPLHQPTQRTQWSQTQETLIPTQTNFSHLPQGGLPMDLAGTPSGIRAPAKAPAMAAPAVSKNKQGKFKQGGGRKTGSKGYTEEETMYLLDLMEEYIPVGGTAWETIARLHNEIYSDFPRTRDSLKRLYQGLLRKKVPTGDPHCPPDVKKAKEIEQLIAAKTRAGDISEENGGAMAALAGMEIDASLSSGTPEGTQALSVKRSSPKMNQQLFIEQIMAWQMMQSQQMAAQREQDRQQDKRDRRQNKMMMQMMMMNQQMQMAAVFGKKPKPMNINFEFSDSEDDDSPAVKKPRTKDDEDGKGV